MALQVEEGDSRHTYSQTSSNWTGVVNSIKKGTAAPSRMPCRFYTLEYRSESHGAPRSYMFVYRVVSGLCA